MQNDNHFYKIVDENPEMYSWVNDGWRIETYTGNDQYNGKPMLVKNEKDRYHTFGVYIIYVKDVPVYIGYSKNVDERITCHRAYINDPDLADKQEGFSLTKRQMYRCLHYCREDVLIQIVGRYKTKAETMNAEDELILKYDPAFNVQRLVNGKRVKDPHFDIKTTQQLIDWVNERKPVLQRPRMQIVDCVTGEVIGTFEYTDSPNVLAVRKLGNSADGIGTTL